MSGPRALLLGVLSIGAALWCAALVRAGPAEPDIGERYIPGDVDVFLSVEHAAKWRGTAVGEPMRALLTSFLDREDAGAAWAKFARQLDVEPDEAFDRILGRRFTFVQRSGGRAPATWVILSEVDRGVARLLRTKLKPVPRGIRDGLPIMSLEGGRFQMAIRDAGARSILFLGPSDAPKLFDQITSGLDAKSGHSLPDQAHFRQLERIAGDAPGKLLLRLPEQPGGWLGVGARPEWNRLEIDLFVDSPALAQTTAGVKAWSHQVALDLDERSFIAAMEWSMPTQLPYSLLGLIERFVDAVPPAFQEPGLVAQRRVIVIDPSEHSLARAAVAFESNDLQALAPIGDRFIAASLGPFWREDQATTVIDMQGEFPRAMRRVDLSDAFERMMSWVFDDGPILCWRYVEPRLAIPNAGWWTIGSEPDQLERVSVALEENRRGDEPPARWVSVGSARPRALLEAFAARDHPIDPAQFPFAQALERTELLQWGVFRASDGTLRGKIELRFAWARR